MSNATAYIDDVQNPYLRSNINKKKEVAQMRPKTEPKSINDMNTASIVWHLVCRHKFTIALVYSACITMAYVSRYYVV